MPSIPSFFEPAFPGKQPPLERPLPPEVAKRAEQLAWACKAVGREIRKLRGEMVTENIRFPSALDTELSHLDFSVDALFVILNTPHLRVDAKNPE